MSNKEFKAPVIYNTGIFGNLNWWGLGDITNFMEALRDEIPWEQRDAPRKECFMSNTYVGCNYSRQHVSLAYTYGKGAGIRTYYSASMSPIVKAIEGLTDHYDCGGLELCFANYYDGPRDHLGWHADDSDMIDHTKPIAVFSAGAEREIWFRENGSDEVEKLILEDCSLLIMKPGMQFTHQHRIPKHGANCGPRVSLTYRGLKRE